MVVTNNQLSAEGMWQEVPDGQLSQWTLMSCIYLAYTIAFCVLSGPIIFLCFSHMVVTNNQLSAEGMRQEVLDGLRTLDTFRQDVHKYLDQEHQIQALPATQDCGIVCIKLQVTFFCEFPDIPSVHVSHFSVPVLTPNRSSILLSGARYMLACTVYSTVYSTVSAGRSQKPRPTNSVPTGS